MEKIIYIDCSSGISGDMMLGALIDLGCDFNYLISELSKLNLSGYSIEKEIVKKCGMQAVKFNTAVTERHQHRSYLDICKIIKESGIKDNAKNIALSTFDIIAAAEAKVHGVEKNEVHFHEIGAVDSILDIAGASIAIDYLKVNIFYSSNVPLGKGFVKTMHGLLPVPAPATIEILKNVPVYAGDFDFEATTPTGAALIKNLAQSFSGMPDMQVESIGTGAGSKDSDFRPNILRLFYGTTSCVNEESKNEVFKSEDLALLATNIDDISSEIIGSLFESLFNIKVLDVWVENILMKKNRPSFKLNVLCNPEKETEVLKTIFKETSTFGIRKQSIKRFFIDREIKIADLPYGKAEVKIGFINGEAATISPEYESIKKLSDKTNKPLKEIYRDAVCFFSNR